MKQRFLVFALCVAGATSAWAHHSLAAEFDQKKPVKLNGKMTKLDWRNPHAWVYIDVKGADGKTEKWQCELGSPNAMTRAGFNQDSIKIGDEIYIDGVLAKKDAKTCSTRVISDAEGNTLLRQ
jgi:hypothetical protein